MADANSNDRGSFAPHVACRCQVCADRHGDQALTQDEVVIAVQRAAVDRLSAELAEARALFDEALEWMGANPPTTGWGTLDKRADRERTALQRRISEWMEGKP